MCLVNRVYMRPFQFCRIKARNSCMAPTAHFLATCLRLLTMLAAMAATAQTIGNHPALYDQHGALLPWTPWSDVITREVNWYLKCPVEHGYPRFVYTTFMDGNYQPLPENSTFIPATQDGMGIISYLKYYAWQGKRNPRVLQVARFMGDY